MSNQIEDNNDDWANEAFPAELIANEEEQLMQYANEEEVIDTISNFLNIEGAEFGEQIFNALKEGEVEPIKVLLMIKKMSHIHDFFLGSDKGKFNPKAKEYLKDQIINLVGKETYRAYGAAVSIETIGGATTMDYKECGDIYLNRLYELTAQLKEMVKERESFIKTVLPAEVKTLGVRSHSLNVDRLPVIKFENLDTRKHINIVPPIKYSREGIMVRFPRKKK